MPTTSCDIQILLALFRYHVLNRRQMQRLFFGLGKVVARNTRRRLGGLKARGYITRPNLGQFSEDDGSTTPVYYLTQAGREFLAKTLSDESFLTTNKHLPRSDWLLHWLAISETHIKLDQATSRPGEAIHLERWINEYDLADPKATKPEQKFVLYTLITEQPERLSCQPDSGFVLSLGAHYRVFFLEQDMGSSWPNQVAASKVPGYAAMAERGLVRTIFPEATSDKVFVLVVTTDARRRDALRKAIANKPGADLWKFTVASDLKSDTFFDGAIFYRCEGGAEPLVRRQSRDESTQY